MQNGRIDAEGDIEAVVKKVFWRILPLLFLGYIVSFLDRSNVGLAALTMNKDLGLTATMFGWGAGLFFIGYTLCEVPSNLILYRVGARVWLSRIMITWGIISAGMAFVQGPSTFYLGRFLLGIAEAGFNPGVLVLLGFWIPQEYRSRGYAFFLLGAPISSIVSSPIYAATTSLNGVGGLATWQWLFIVEGVPAIILGLVIYFVLSDRPERVDWLTDPEKVRLTNVLNRERASKSETENYSILKAMLDARVITLSFLNLFFLIGFYGLFFWLPQIIKEFGASNIQVAWLNALPFVMGAIAMMLFAHHSDLKNERFWHTIVASCVSAGGLAMSAIAPTPLTAFLALCVGAMGIFSFLGLYFVLAASFLTGRGFAGGVAIIASFGQIGGFIGGYAVGWLKDYTGSFTAPIFLAAGCLLVPSLLLLLMRSELNTRETAVGYRRKTAAT
jgi:MFS transporter, ACS family, tartrate transporter